MGMGIQVVLGETERVKCGIGWCNVGDLGGR